MSTFKGTPGPWEVGYGENGITGPRCAPSAYIDGNGIRQVPIKQIGSFQAVAWVLESTTDWTPPEADAEPPSTETMLADARLIAAAPDLLEALKDVSGRLELALKLLGNSKDTAALNVKKANAAIAKATTTGDRA